MLPLPRHTTGPTLLVLVHLLALPALGDGKGQGLEVRSAGELQFTTRASEIVTTTFRITNHTDAEQELVETLTLPEGWQAVLPLPGFRLAAGAAETRLVALRVGPTAAAGAYEVVYEAASRRDPAVRDAQTLRVVVPRQSQLALQVDTPPARVVANSTVPLTLHVSNEGNTPLAVRVTAACPSGLSVSLTPETLSLEPRAVGDVALSVRVGETRSKALRIVTLTASGTAEGGGETRTSVNLPLTVLPRSTAVPSLARTLPVELAVSAVGGDEGAGLQLELSGRGALDEAGEHQLDFRLRGPDVSDCGFFGTRDEYVLNYRSPHLAVGLGDRLFGLSELTTQSLYGRGVSFESDIGDDSAVGLWTMRSRWGEPSVTATGAFAGHALSDHANLRLNWLQRRGRADDPDARDDLVSVQANLTPMPRTALGLEYATSRSSDGTSDHAWRVRGAGRVGPSLDWSLLHVTAGPSYHGYYHDCTYTTGTLAARLNRQLELRYAYVRWRANLDRLPVETRSPDETLHRVSLRYAFSRQWGLTFGLDELAVRDAAAPARTDFDSRRLWTALAYSQRRSSVRLEVRHEQRNDRAAGRRENGLEGRVYATYHPSDRLALTAYGGWRDRRSSDEDDPLTAANDLGLSALWQAAENLRVRAWLGQSRSEGLGVSRTTQNGLAIEHREASGRRLALEVRSTEGRGTGRDTAYLLTYAVPFGLPVGRRQGVGAVAGCLTDDDGAPVADAVVSLDQAVTVTDEQGRFSFGEVAPGEHLLGLDAGTLGPRLPERDPGPVQVTGGQVTRVALRLVPAAAISGVVAIAAAGATTGTAVVGDPSQPQLAGTGVADLIVELTRDGEKPRRQSTDLRGRFSFESLRPGLWHMKVYATNLPPLHRLAQPEQDVTVAGGERRPVTVQVLPVARQMRMLGVGAVPVVATTPAASDEHASRRTAGSPRGQ